MKRFLALFPLLMLFGCVGSISPDSLQQGDVGGMSFVVQGKSYEKIWNAASQAMSVDMDIVESHKSSGVIKSRVRPSKVVAFFITPTTPHASSYTVKVVSKNYMHTDFVDRDWEPSVVEYFKSALNLK